MNALLRLVNGPAAGLLLAVVPCAVIATGSPIVVTATRLPTPTDEVGSSVTVITAQDIERRQYRSVADALRSVPNLSVIQSGGGIGKLTVVFARGTESNHTLFLLDGIELNDPAGTDGGVDLSHIYIGDVERIEILNGPQGMLYGSDALGAVIQVFTKKGEGATSAWLLAEGGSFNTFTQRAGAAAGEGRLSWSANVQHTETDGISALGEAFRQPNGILDDDRHENTNIGTRIGFAFSDTASIDFTGRVTRTENDLDLNTSYVSDDSDSHGSAEQLLLGLTSRVSLFEGKTEHRLGLSYTAIDREDIDNVDAVNADDSSRESNRAWKRKIELQNDLYLSDRHVITLGLETEEDTVRSDVSVNFLDFFNMPASINSSVSADIHNHAAYLQDQFVYGNLTGTAGLRVDRHDLFNSATTGRLALSKRFPSHDIRLRGSLATGFKAPTANQLFVSSVTSFGLFTGNPDLKPERSRGFEAGIDKTFRSHAASAGLTLHEQRIKNLITFNDTFTSNENRDRVRIRGIEAYAKGQLDPALAVSLNAAWTRSIDLATDQNLLRRPLRKASLQLDYVPADSSSANIEVVYVGPRYDIDAVSFARKRRGGYTLVNLAASRKLGRHLELHGRISNLFDKDYEEPDGFSQPGAALYAGLTLSH